jgi:hypothetical protein
VNVLLDKKYNKGFNDGTKFGAKVAKRAVADEVIVRLQELRNKKGIGPKTWGKILDSLDLTEGGL